MEEELKREKTMQKTIFYDVYKTTTGLYLKIDMALSYNIGDKRDEKIINNLRCIKIKESDLEKISKEADSPTIKLVPNFKSIFDLQLVSFFNVLIDTSHNNRTYIQDSICTKYNIEPLTKRTIDKVTYYQVRQEDIDSIEKMSKKENIELKRIYIKLELKDEMKAAENLFIYCYDTLLKKAYVNRDTYETIIKKGIQLEGTPKIINNKNCYSITENELKEVEEVLNYRGIEQLLKPNYTVEEKKEEEIDTFIVYHDRITDKYYIPKEYASTNAKPHIIMNKECYETDINSLEHIFNKRIIIADVFPYNKAALEIIICNYNGHLFIGENILELLDLYIEDPYRIIIGGQIYDEISDGDLELLQTKEFCEYKLNIIIKNIIPKKG